jgi:hypothetical protein
MVALITAVAVRFSAAKQVDKIDSAIGIDFVASPNISFSLRHYLNDTVISK